MVFDCTLLSTQAGTQLRTQAGTHLPGVRPLTYRYVSSQRALLAMTDPSPLAMMEI